VSPIGRRFFTARGAVVFEGELLLVWLPAAIFAGLCGWARRSRGR
jgi:hypothetical protein